MSSGGFCLDDDTSVGIFGDPSPGLLVRLSARGLIGLSRVAWLSSGMSSADANAQHPDRHQHHYGQEVVAWRCTNFFLKRGARPTQITTKKKKLSTVTGCTVS